MRVFAFSDLAVGIGMLLVVEGLLLASLPQAAKKAMEAAIATPETILRITGIVSAVLGLVVVWIVRSQTG